MGSDFDFGESCSKVGLTADARNKHNLEAYSMEEGDDVQGKLPSKGRPGVYSYLKSIDQRLELVVKILGYVSVLVITPLFFIATLVGVDVYSAFGLRKYSEAQSILIDELEAKGWSVDEAGSLKAFRAGDPEFDRFMFLKVKPNPADAAAVVRNFLQNGMLPPSQSAEYRSFLSEAEPIRQTIEAYVVRYNSLRAAEGKMNERSLEDFCVFSEIFARASNYRSLFLPNVDCQSNVKLIGTANFFADVHPLLREWALAAGIEGPDTRASNTSGAQVSQPLVFTILSRSQDGALDDSPKILYMGKGFDIAKLNEFPPPPFPIVIGTINTAAAANLHECVSTIYTDPHYGTDFKAGYFNLCLADLPASIDAGAPITLSNSGVKVIWSGSSNNFNYFEIPLVGAFWLSASEFIRHWR